MSAPVLSGISQPMSVTMTYSLTQPLPGSLPIKPLVGLQDGLPVRKPTVATNIEDLKLELQKLHNSSVSSLSLKANIEQGLQAIFSQTVPAQTITTPAHSQPQVLSYVQPPSTPTAQSPVGYKLISNHPLSQAVGGSQISAELSTTLSSSISSIITTATTTVSTLPRHKISRFQITAVKDDPLLRNSSCTEGVNLETVSIELPQSNASESEENLDNKDLPSAEMKGRFHVTLVADQAKQVHCNGTTPQCDANANLIPLSNDSNDKSSQTCIQGSDQKHHQQLEDIKVVPSVEYKMDNSYECCSQYMSYSPKEFSQNLRFGETDINPVQFVSTMKPQNSLHLLEKSHATSSMECLTSDSFNSEEPNVELGEYATFPNSEAINQFRNYQSVAGIPSSVEIALAQIKRGAFPTLASQYTQLSGSDPALHRSQSKFPVLHKVHDTIHGTNVGNQYSYDVRFQQQLLIRVKDVGVQTTKVSVRNVGINTPRPTVRYLLTNLQKTKSETSLNTCVGSAKSGDAFVTSGGCSPQHLLSSEDKTLRTEASGSKCLLDLPRIAKSPSMSDMMILSRNKSMLEHGRSLSLGQFLTALTMEDHRDFDDYASSACDDYLQQLLIRQQKERDELKKRHKQELEIFKHERRLFHQKACGTEEDSFSSVPITSSEAQQCCSAQLFGSKLSTGTYQSSVSVNHLTVHSCQSPIVHSHVSRPNELKFGSRSNLHSLPPSHSSAPNIYSSKSGPISPLSAPSAVGNDVDWNSRNTLCRSSSEGIPTPGRQTSSSEQPLQKPRNRTLTEDLIRIVQMIGSKPKSGVPNSPTSTINAMTSEQKMTLNQIKQRQLQDMFIDVKSTGKIYGGSANASTPPPSSPLSSPSMQRHINNLSTVPTQYRTPPHTIPVNSQLPLDWQNIGSAGRTTTHSYITVTSAITHSSGSHLSSTFSHLPSSPPSPLSTCHGNHSPGK